MRQKNPFGLSVDGAVLIPQEYFALNHCPVAGFSLPDILPLFEYRVPIAFGLWLYLKNLTVRYIFVLRWCSCWINLIWFCRLLHPSRLLRLVCHELWFRADTRHSGQCGRLRAL